jgi:putative endonuclease
MGDNSYYVYILASFRRVLYIGFTRDLRKRIWEHREGVVAGFTKKYNVKMLVYYEMYKDPLEAISREKQLKRWSRGKKIKLIESVNPEWKDLYQELFF